MPPSPPPELDELPDVLDEPDELDDEALLEALPLLVPLPLDSEPPQAMAINPNIGKRVMGNQVRCMYVLRCEKVPEKQCG